MEIKSFEEIVTKIKKLKGLGQFDFVLGVANGGIVPAYLLSNYLGIPLEIIHINFRDVLNMPSREKPILTKPINFDFHGKSIVVVDDRVNSGSTIQFVRQILKGASVIKTVTVNGKADYSLFDEECFLMPWNIKLHIKK